MFLSLFSMFLYSSKTLAATFTTGQKFQIILSSIPDLIASPHVAPSTTTVFDIDLFDTDADTIAGLQAQGKIVVCYFSAGTYEPWRPDAGNFTKADMGSSLAPDWPDEYWLDVNSINVKRIMKNRIELAAAKGCDGIDPDNTDGYQNPNNTLSLTASTLTTYITYLSSISTPLSLSLGLKNSLSLLPTLSPLLSFAVNEQCAQFSECNAYIPFLAEGKPVFQIEYLKNVPVVEAGERMADCVGTGVQGMSTVFKDLALSGWVGYCDGSEETTVTKPGGGTNPWTPGKPHSSSSSTTKKPTSTRPPISSRSSTARPTTTKSPITTRSSTVRPTTKPPSTTKTSSTIKPTTTSSSGGCKSKHWDQCGGNDWKGCTVCEAGFTCKGVSPPYYYQCL